MASDIWAAVKVVLYLARNLALASLGALIVGGVVVFVYDRIIALAHRKWQKMHFHDGEPLDGLEGGREFLFPPSIE